MDISGYCMHHRLYPASKNFVYTLWASPFDLCEYLSWLNGIQFTRSRIERDHIVARLREMSNICTSDHVRSWFGLLFKRQMETKLQPVVVTHLKIEHIKEANASRGSYFYPSLQTTNYQSSDSMKHDWSYAVLLTTRQ